MCRCDRRHRVRSWPRLYGKSPRRRLSLPRVAAARTPIEPMTSPPLLALLAALGFGVAGVLLRRALGSTTPLAAAMVSVSFTTVFVCLLALATTPVERLFTWRISPFLVAGLLAPGLARLAYFVGIARVGAARAIPLVSTAPVFAVVVAIIALGERPSPIVLLAVACIAAGGGLVAARDQVSGAWRRI